MASGIRIPSAVWRIDSKLVRTRKDLSSISPKHGLTVTRNLRVRGLRSGAFFPFSAFSVLPPRGMPLRYLAQNLEQGFVTPLTFAYRDAILRLTGAADLKGAEEVIARAGCGR